MATYLELKTQIDKLQTQADALKKKERAGVIERVKEAIAAFELTAAELGLAGKKGRTARTTGAVKKTAAKGAKVSKRTKTTKKVKASAAPKFADGSGNTWSGRGPRPAWFKAALEGGATPESLTAKS